MPVTLGAAYSGKRQRGQLLSHVLQCGYIVEMSLDNEVGICNILPKHLELCCAAACPQIECIGESEAGSWE